MARSTGAVVAVTVLLGAVPMPSALAQDDVLPDLDQVVPSGLTVDKVRVAKRKVQFRLGFNSAATNVGAGPLRLRGHRASRAKRTMAVDQLIDRTAGAEPRIVRDVGSMRYVIHPDHRHWHLLGFERYELRLPDGSTTPVRRDRKTGFCLGDRYRVPSARELPGFNPIPTQVDQCGLSQPGLTEVTAGISVGYGDDYRAQIEGQYIDVTGLPAAQYVLVHRVNTDSRLVELDYTNNASSLLFELTWPRGQRRKPALRVLERCSATARCP
jgi:hypothetical protein